MGSNAAGAVRAFGLPRLIVAVAFCGLAAGALPAGALARHTPPPVPTCFSEIGICDGVPLKSTIGAVKLTNASHGLFKLTGPAPLQTTTPVACGDAGCIYNHLDWIVGIGGTVKRGCQTNTTTCEVQVPLGSDSWVPVVVNQNDYPQALFLLWKSQCNAGVAADRASLGAASGRRAHAALNNMCTNHGAAYYARTLLYSATSLAGRAVQILSVGGAAALATGTAPSGIGPAASISLGIIGLGAGQAISIAANHAQDDPPDPAFRSLVAVAKIPAVKLRPERGVTTRALRALKAYAGPVLEVGALARALATTIDRAGGAIGAHNSAAEGRQIRDAITLCHTLSDRLHAAIRAAQALERAAPGSSALLAPLDASTLRAEQQKVAQSGVPATLSQLVRKYGGTPGELGAQIEAPLPADLPRNVLDAAAGRGVIHAFGEAAKAFLAYAQVPQIIRESKLR